MAEIGRGPAAGRFAPGALPERVAGPLREAVARLAALRPPPRRERLSGIHNPWGAAAGLTDPWRFLNVCESAAVLDAVEAVIGPDIVLWDSELYLRGSDYRDFAAAGREGRYWPVAPLAGAVAWIAPDDEDAAIQVADVHVADINDGAQLAARIAASATPLYVMRYLPATSRFVRDPKLPANDIAMREQLLINYTTRPLWLVRGEDRAHNDFVTGFASDPPRWAPH